MARGLIVGCGCCGRGLGRALLDRGWQVRGTTRSRDGLEAIEAAGIEAVIADPDRIGTVLDQIEGVTLIFWLLGSATGDDDAVGALHGPRLERLLEEVVDTPVRGLVYELTGKIAPEHAIGAFELLREAQRRWRIPFEVVDAPRDDREIWREGMLGAAGELVGGSLD